MIDLRIIRKHVVSITKLIPSLTRYIDLSKAGPIAITRKGEIDAFIISAETYDKLVEALEELEKKKQGGAS